MFGQPQQVKQRWEAQFPDAEKAYHCIRCGKCETVCPQQLPIRTALAQLQQGWTHCKQQNGRVSPAVFYCGITTDGSL